MDTGESAEVVAGGFRERRGGEVLRGGVNDGVETAELGDDFSDKRSAAAREAEVGGERSRRAAGADNGGGDFVSGGAAGVISQDDMIAGGAESAGDGGTDAAGTARDESDAGLL